MSHKYIQKHYQGPPPCPRRNRAALKLFHNPLLASPHTFSIPLASGPPDAPPGVAPIHLPRHDGALAARAYRFRGRFSSALHFPQCTRRMQRRPCCPT